MFNGFGRPAIPADRRFVALGACLVVAAGLSVALLMPDGFTSDALGDALYAVLIFLVVLFIVPRAHPIFVGSIALLWCVGVELFQLSGLPEAWGSAFFPAMLVFGTVYSPVDIVMYAIGIACATVSNAAWRARPSPLQ